MSEVTFNPGEGRRWVRPTGQQMAFYNQEAQLNPANVKELKKVEHKLVLEINNKSDNPFPQYANAFDSGFDLRAFIEGVENRIIQIYPGETKMFNTGLYMKIPHGYEGQVRTRSGMAVKNQIIVTNSPGTIDAEYRGEICVILTNLSQKIKDITNGDRIAQFVVCPVIDESKIELLEVEEVNTDTERGVGGFGHTGFN